MVSQCFVCGHFTDRYPSQPSLFKLCCSLQLPAPAARTPRLTSRRFRRGRPTSQPPSFSSAPSATSSGRKDEVGTMRTYVVRTLTLLCYFYVFQHADYPLAMMGLASGVLNGTTSLTYCQSQDSSLGYYKQCTKAKIDMIFSDRR